MNSNRSIRILIACLALAWFVFQVVVGFVEMAVGRAVDMDEAWKEVRGDAFFAAFALMLIAYFISQNEKDKAESKSAGAKKLFAPSELSSDRHSAYSPSPPPKPSLRSKLPQPKEKKPPPNLSPPPIMRPPPLSKREYRP